MGRIEEKYLDELDLKTRQAQLVADQSRLDMSRQDVSMQEQQQDGGMVMQQLDVSDILNNMYYLLKGSVLKRNEQTGQMEWTAPESNDMIILSDHGVNYVLGAVQWYVNKNTLLSNYEDEQILTKMEDFATTLTDNIFMDYENMFCYPTLQDCKDELERRIKKKVDIKAFSLSLANKEVDEDLIRSEILKEMEERIEHEMQVIAQQKLKSKLKRFESIIRFVQDTVHSSYNRAWKGQERKSLREHMHISESKGGMGFQDARPQFTMNPMKAFGSNK